MLGTLIPSERKYFQQLLEGFIDRAWISELTWKRVPDGGSGDRECL